MNERNRALRERAATWVEEQFIGVETQRAIEAALPVEGRTHGFLAQCVFFVLTSIGMAATFGLTKIFDMPGFISGIAFLAAAEFLLARKWFATGVESALWLGGLFAILTDLPNSGKPEALLVFAAACALAGARVRNPLFGTGAALFVVAYAETKFDRGVIVALVLALVACIALLRTWRRPSTEWLWIFLAVVLPCAGRVAADAQWRSMTIALYAAFGVLVLTLAFVKRHHALVLAGAIGLAIANVELSRMIARPLELKLAAGGAFLLLIAYVVSRALRDKTSGIVVTPARPTSAEDALSIAGALAASHQTKIDAPEPGRAQGEGGFGGAGASGDY
ncbi:MAG TPA: hypothetical protein VJZ00_13445 [Thermoanaerobaculia bacterium]|nr:hypothetical protein [Thermoanaerobaculia bacterium]